MKFAVYRLVVLGVAALLVAELATTILEHVLWKIPGAAPGSMEPEQERSHVPLEAILERNIFDAELDTTVDPPPDRRIQSCSERATVGWRLVGTSVSQHGSALAVLADRSGRSVVLSSGDELEGLRVVEIQRRRIWLSTEQGCEVLQLEASFEAPVVQSATLQPRPVFAAKRVGPAAFEVERSAVEGVLQDFTQLRGRVIPLLKDGRPTGFRITSIRPGSPFTAIGIENGDVVRAINGYELNDPARMFDLLTKLKDATTLTVDLTRRGRPHSIRYDIN